jgi:hypothetical protein
VAVQGHQPETATAVGLLWIFYRSTALQRLIRRQPPPLNSAMVH